MERAAGAMTDEVIIQASKQLSNRKAINPEQPPYFAERFLADSIERELLLRKGNAQLQLMNQILLETNYLGVIITNVLGTIVNINENAIEMLDMTTGRNERLVGSSVFELKDLAHYFQSVIHQKEEYSGIELTLERKGSMEFYILDVVSVYDTKGSLARVIGSGVIK